MSIVFRRVRSSDPQSVLVEWGGIDGSIRQWLFSADNTTVSEVKSKQINSINAFRGIPNSNKREVALISFDMNPDEFDYVSDVQFSNLIEVTIQDVLFRAAISSIKITQLNPQKLRTLSLKIILQPTLLMNN